jgi:hypothetical protein
MNNASSKAKERPTLIRPPSVKKTHYSINEENPLFFARTFNGPAPVPGLLTRFQSGRQELDPAPNTY